MGFYKNAVLTVIVLKILMHCCETNASRIIFPPLYLFWRGGSSTLDENDDFLNKYYVPESEIKAIESAAALEQRRIQYRKQMQLRQRLHGHGYSSRRDMQEMDKIYGEDGKMSLRSEDKPWYEHLPKINMAWEPLINFKLKQRFVMLGSAITLGIDYLSDISQWRYHCAIEDTFVQGRFSLRGSELGWAKSWLLNLGLGEENTAKFKLRLGLNLKTYKAYAKLRFRTEPISPFDIGEGISCAGKLPLPVFLLPVLRSVPLRIEYKMRINASKPTPIDIINTSRYRRKNKDKVVFLTTGIGTVDLSLEELNFCLEWDEKSPLWGIDIVKSEPMRKFYSGLAKVDSPFQGMRGLKPSSPSSSSSSPPSSPPSQAALPSNRAQKSSTTTTTTTRGG